mmetsp:Transcript_997/g.3044  ORF Transcript_997/g.3044 Transcript_997/m.3044 type:complete len:367 (+) Transcript_997:348-1448(+)
MVSSPHQQALHRHLKSGFPSSGRIAQGGGGRQQLRGPPGVHPRQHRHRPPHVPRRLVRRQRRGHQGGRHRGALRLAWLRRCHGRICESSHHAPKHLLGARGWGSYEVRQCGPLSTNCLSQPWRMLQDGRLPSWWSCSESLHQAPQQGMPLGAERAIQCTPSTCLCNLLWGGCISGPCRCTCAATCCCCGRRVRGGCIWGCRRRQSCGRGGCARCSAAQLVELSCGEGFHPCCDGVSVMCAHEQHVLHQSHGFTLHCQVCCGCTLQHNLQHRRSVRWAQEDDVVGCSETGGDPAVPAGDGGGQEGGHRGGRQQRRLPQHPRQCAILRAPPVPEAFQELHQHALIGAFDRRQRCLPARAHGASCLCHC